MITVYLIAGVFALLGGLALPPAITYLGIGLLGAAVVGAVVGGVVSHAKHSKSQSPNEFENLVAREMERQGVSSESFAQAQQAQAEEDELAPEAELSSAQPAQTSDSDSTPVAEEDAPLAADVPAEDAEVEMAAGSPTLSEEEIAPELEEDLPLVRNDDAPLGSDDVEDEPIPDPIPVPDNTAAAPTVVPIDVNGTQEEEEEIVSAVEETEEVDMDESLLDSMTVKTDEYDDFDFDGDFDNWVGEIEQADFDGDGGVNALLMALGTDEVEETEETEDDLADLDIDEEAAADATDAETVVTTDDEAAAGITGSKYRRSFRSKLMQGSPANKRYYSIIKNELMSYDKIRCSESWGGESFLFGRRTYVRMGISGKTLCVFLALDPNGYDPNLLHHRDKSGVRKYASTPMMMRVRSDLSLRRTITLILYIVKDNGIRKKAEFRPVDYASALRYADDEALLELNLIKLNPHYVQKLSSVEQLEAEEAEARRRQFRDVTPVKKEQVGNLTDEDIDKLERKRERTDATTRQNASAEGKFVVEAEGGVCRFMYYAPNGRLLCTSDTYGSTELAIRAVNAYRNSINSGKAEFSTADGKYFYTVHAHGRVFRSASYDAQSDCLEGYRTAREYADRAVVEYLIS